MKRNEWIQWATNELKNAGIETPRLDAEVLLAFVLRIERIRLHMYPEKEVEQDAGEQFEILIKKRRDECPVAYLTGEQEFMGLQFMVTPEVLIPRPDTETLAETVLEWVKNTAGSEKIQLADIGTGSGAIAVSLAYYCPAIQVVATDLSHDALKIAEENAKRHHVLSRIEFLYGDLMEPLIEKKYVLDALVSNPPYITEKEAESLPGSVAGYEPMLALLGGKDGLDPYRKILAEGLELLRPGALVAFEMGWQQGEDLKSLMEEWGLEGVQIIKDLSGRDRVTTGYKQSCQ
ncbi:MAG: peptide chain release factor N(5)-glutamine methyltransferase [Tindallia sp. MSAO_Bac2]|nr:MAG: peptide chain release factor N(5)-glutamine methyltransferase [Tindallia sp. MSAO_Bac2]